MDNVFSAHFLPNSARIATCAGDRQVRLFDVRRGSGHHHTSEACIKVLRCHRGRVKRVVPQEGPDYFLTVSEDQTVRGHDLRTPHSCPTCPPPLVRTPHPLSTLATSSLSPWLFFVAGESPYAHLFDRRMIHRVMLREWGVPAKDDEIVTCVRRFGRASRAPGESEGDEHVSGARMSSTNGHELILSYMADGVYLFSIYDDPVDVSSASRERSILPSSSRHKRRRLSRSPSIELARIDEASYENGGELDDGLEISGQELIDALMADDNDDDEAGDGEDNEDGERANENEEDDNHLNEGGDSVAGETDKEDTSRWASLAQPVVYPRRRFAGVCNVETIKDVNFLGPNDEYIASGSDDGNWFLWSKETAEIVGIWEGDGSVVNCIEGHPTLPLVAVSGIDSSVKLFGPERVEVSLRKIQDKEKIVHDNANPQRRLAHLRRIQLQNLVLSLRFEDDREGRNCVIM
ncbi:WD40-repeat-containing domain protein [Cantharellus anzutake]|uniref:WD40-repeat-containing domain protein n=1 Tax=Cantharellus anzutake TaxID=1750568 RepID=UPI0019053D8C|nr:WD40-repeat-containing domain protein [Cantharellus anzutake]KAF8339108.1 WD40-repeat-containing domain protein [Cantharellus anzutake]